MTLMELGHQGPVHRTSRCFSELDLMEKLQEKGTNPVEEGAVIR